MPGITTAVCDSFRKELFQGVHAFAAAGGHTFKMCLLRAGASLVGTYGAGTTNYSNITGNADEATDTGGSAQYTAGGFTMTPNADPGLDTGNHVAWVSWATNPSWGSAASIVASGALLYNTSQSNKGVGAWSFGGDKACTLGTFTLTLPAAAYNSALLRLA